LAAVSAGAAEVTVAAFAEDAFRVEVLFRAGAVFCVEVAFFAAVFSTAAAVFFTAAVFWAALRAAALFTGAAFFVRAVAFWAEFSAIDGSDTFVAFAVLFAPMEPCSPTAESRRATTRPAPLACAVTGDLDTRPA
jgi:hypothetical protein